MEIDNRIITVYGRRGAGKTMTSSIIADNDYDIVYANYYLSLKKTKVYQYKDFTFFWDLLQKRTFHSKKGLIIFDEGGINMNARESGKQVNKLVSKVMFVSRKLNLDMIFIAQTQGTDDINIRRQADYNFFLSKSKDSPNLFDIDVEVTTFDERTGKEIYLNDGTIEDPVNIIKEKQIKYDTLDASIME